MSELVLEKESNLPQGWNAAKLIDICDIKGRVGWKGYKKSDLRQKGIYVIGGEHIDKNDNLDFSKPKFISEEKYLESPEIMVKPNDIILSHTGSIGKIAIVTKGLGKITINPNVLLIKNIQINHYFLYYFFRSPLFQNLLFEGDSSSTIPTITQKFLKAQNLPIPPVNEQKRIASKIEELFSKLDNTKRIIENTVDQVKIKKQSFLYFALDGKLTEGWRKKNNIKQHMEKNPLENLLIFSKNGFTGRPNNQEVGYARLGIETITRSNSIYVDISKCKFIEISSSKLDSYMAKEGDLFVCRQNGNKNYVGKCAVFKNTIKPTIFSDSLIQLRINQEFILPEYLTYYLNSVFGRHQIEQFCSTTAGNYSINGTNLKKTIVAYPSIPEQEIIISKIAVGYSLIKNSENLLISSIKKIEVLKNALLKLTFEGKLVPQDPNDEPAEVFLKKIKQEKEQLKQKEKKSRGKKNAR